MHVSSGAVHDDIYLYLFRFLRCLSLVATHLACMSRTTPSVFPVAWIRAIFSAAALPYL